IQLPAVVLALNGNDAEVVVPASRLVCCTNVILDGGALTVKVTPLLATPFTVTTTGPVSAPFGTDVPMLVLLQLPAATVASVPLNLTVLVPCVPPKFAPAIVTPVPTAPDAGVTLVMLGGTGTVKVTPLLATPFTVTTTGPVSAPFGTDVTMLVLLQLPAATVASVPLNVTVLVPCVPPKFAPAIVTPVPTAPDDGVTLVMLGAAGTVKVTPLLATPFTFT